MKTLVKLVDSMKVFFEFPFIKIRIDFLPTTLPETNSEFAPENRPKRPKRKGSFSNHPFSAVNLLASFQGV